MWGKENMLLSGLFRSSHCFFSHVINELFLVLRMHFRYLLNVFHSFLIIVHVPFVNVLDLIIQRTVCEVEF